MGSSIVKVAGEASVKGEADAVELSLQVSYLARSAEDALAEVTKGSVALEEVFESLGVEKRQWSTSGISVHKETEWTKDRHVDRGYRASNSLLLRLDEPSVAGRLIKEATIVANVRVEGPYWKVALDNPARTEACRQAAAEARRKAEAYAEALGTRLGPVLSIVESQFAFEDRFRGEHMAYNVVSHSEQRESPSKPEGSTFLPKSW